MPFYSSCDLLDLSPEDNYSSTSYWKNESHVNSYMLGIHNDLRSKYKMLFVLGEARGGTLKTGTSSLGTTLEMPVIKNNLLTKDQTGISEWYGLYNNILHLNLFINKVENECGFLSADKRSYYLGQAYGLRAFYYFWMYRTWGGVPMVTDTKVLNGKVSAEGLYTGRSTAKEILDFIKSDVHQSELYFDGRQPESPTKTMWSLDATMVLKAEVYLWSAKVPTDDQKPADGDIIEAKKALQPLIGKYKLLPSFKKVFSEKGNDEVIMAIRFKEGEETNFFGEFISKQTNFINQVRGRDNKVINKDTLQDKNTGLLKHEYKWELFDVFDDDDTRRDATFLEYYTLKKPYKFQGMVVRKNMGIVNSEGKRIYEGDVIIYRYADVLLLMAEIENKLGNSVASYIDEIRQRAYGNNFDSHKYTDADFATNEKAILLERDKEFIAEGKRWFDVVRMEDAEGKSLVFSSDVNYRYQSSDMKTAILDENEAYKLLWPVDIGTLNADPLLEQTEGYMGVNMQK